MAIRLKVNHKKGKVSNHQYTNSGQAKMNF